MNDVENSTKHKKDENKDRTLSQRLLRCYENDKLKEFISQNSSRTILKAILDLDNKEKQKLILRSLAPDESATTTDTVMGPSKFSSFLHELLEADHDRFSDVWVDWFRTTINAIDSIQSADKAEIIVNKLAIIHSKNQHKSLPEIKIPSFDIDRERNSVTKVRDFLQILVRRYDLHSYAQTLLKDNETTDWVKGILSSKCAKKRRSGLYKTYLKNNDPSENTIRMDAQAAAKNGGAGVLDEVIEQTDVTPQKLVELMFGMSSIQCGSILTVVRRYDVNPEPIADSIFESITQLNQLTFAVETLGLDPGKAESVYRHAKNRDVQPNHRILAWFEQNCSDATLAAFEI